MTLVDPLPGLPLVPVVKDEGVVRDALSFVRLSPRGLKSAVELPNWLRRLPLKPA